MCDNDAGDVEGQFEAFGRIAILYARSAKFNTAARAFTVTVDGELFTTKKRTGSIASRFSSIR